MVLAEGREVFTAECRRALNEETNAERLLQIGIDWSQAIPFS